MATAYQIVEENKNLAVDRAALNKLIDDFQSHYLSAINYQANIARHRRPSEYTNAVIMDIYNIQREIQSRPELSHVHGIKHSFVTSEINELWVADKTAKSLFNTIKKYCSIYGKDITIVAPHVAEYRAFVKLAMRLRRNLNANLKRVLARGDSSFTTGAVELTGTDSLAKSFMAIACGTESLLSVSAEDFRIAQFETAPPKGIILHPAFPNCCDLHRAVFREAIKTFEKFPGCCEGHRKLVAMPWFNRNEYAYLPLKLITTISYTSQLIHDSLHKPDFVEDVSDYIDYTVRSFGQFPRGYGAPLGLSQYLDSVETFIKEQAEMNKSAKVKLLAVISVHRSPGEKPIDSEINILIDTYKKWLKLFPFNIPYFSHLRDGFDENMPFIKGTGKTNRYSGLTLFQLQTKKDLLNILSVATTKVLQQINAAELLRLGLLTDLEQPLLEIAIANRRIQAEELDSSIPKDHTQYIKTIKRWLKDEKAFFNAIKPIFKATYPVKHFINDIAFGIRKLQSHGINAPCIKAFFDGEKKEHDIRVWFSDFFSARYPKATVNYEVIKGEGRIDLKVDFTSMISRIIEFKGWWNADKKYMAAQVSRYLTDFENEGFIFLINHLRTTDIREKYKTLVSLPDTGYVANSWKDVAIEGTGFKYFESEYQSGEVVKKLYHFIFNVYP